MKKITALLLLLALLLAACGDPQTPTTQPTVTTTQTPAKPTEPTVPQIESVQSGPVTLTNAGTFKHTGDMKFANGAFLLRYDESNANAPYQLLSPLGEQMVEESFNAATALGNGIALVSRPGEDYDTVGLVDYCNGLVLAPCEAVLAICISQRFCMLVYAETIAESEEEAFYYYTDPEGAKVYYTGYAKIMDITTGAFVPEVKLTEMPQEVGSIGQRFYVCYGNTTEIYNEDGTVALSMENAVIRDDVAMHSGMGGIYLYNSELEQIAQLKYASQRLTLLSGGFIRFYEDGSYQALDLQGNRISQDTFEDVCFGAAGCVVVRKAEGYGILSAAGEEILPCDYVSIKHLRQDKFLLLDKEGHKILYGLDGVSVDVTDMLGEDRYFYTETENGRSYLLSTGERLELTGEVTEMGYGLVSSKEGVFELYTGGKLLSGYDRYAYCDGYVYAAVYGIWTVFRIEIAQS